MNVVAGFYWYHDPELEGPIVVHVYDVFRFFPGSEERLEVTFPGTDHTERVEELKYPLIGPIMVPPHEPLPEVREKAVELARSWVEAMLKDPTCSVKIEAGTVVKTDDWTAESGWREIRIGINGGGKP